MASSSEQILGEGLDSFPGNDARVRHALLNPIVIHMGQRVPKEKSIDQIIEEADDGFPGDIMRFHLAFGTFKNFVIGY